MTLPANNRLDLNLDRIKDGRRFLYRYGGTGKIYEGQLRESVQDGDKLYVKLHDQSRIWDIADTIFITHMFSLRDEGRVETKVDKPSIEVALPAPQRESPKPTKSVKHKMKSLKLTIGSIGLLLGLCGSIQAQNWRTNDLALPFSVITAAANSNVFGGAGSWTAPSALRLTESVRDVQLLVSFSCPTVTVAQAIFQLQVSPDSNRWSNLPHNTPYALLAAGAGSQGTTNIVLGTNFTRAQLLGANWVRFGGATNGNAATITLTRVTVVH